MGEKEKVTVELEFKKASFIADVTNVSESFNDFETIKEVLNSLGIIADYTNGRIMISTESMEEILKYHNKANKEAKNPRGAGRKIKQFRSEATNELLCEVGDIYYLKHVENKTYQQIADDIGMSVATLYRRKRRVESDKFFQEWYKETLDKTANVSEGIAYELWHNGYGLYIF